MVRGRLFGLAVYTFFAPALAACELVIGGENHAVVQSRDGAVEGAADAGPATPETGVPGPDTSLPDTAMPDVQTGPPGPCLVPPPCTQSEQNCRNDCTQQFNTCQKGHGDPHDDDCMTAFDDCTATCQTTCIACADCAQPAAACMLP
jgi:hypothetical protein